MVTDNDAAQFANLTAENISGFSERENPRAPTKQSPAPTVSIALTFLDLKYFLFPFSYAITPESPRVITTFTCEGIFNEEKFLSMKSNQLTEEPY